MKNKIQNILELDWRHHSYEISSEDRFKLSIGYYHKLELKFTKGFAQQGWKQLKDWGVVTYYVEGSFIGTIESIIPITVQFYEDNDNIIKESYFELPVL